MEVRNPTDHELVARAQGCLLGQLAGDALGSLVEFRTAEQIRREYPNGVQGWVLIALRNALWQLLHATSLEEGVIDTIMRGGDTDTNAAICGALLGAVHGRDAVPGRWIETLLTCRPQAGRPNVRQPRPPCYWPVDALELAERLVRRNGSIPSGIPPAGKPQDKGATGNTDDGQ